MEEEAPLNISACRAAQANLFLNFLITTASHWKLAVTALNVLEKKPC